MKSLFTSHMYLGLNFLYSKTNAVALTIRNKYAMMSNRGFCNVFKAAHPAVFLSKVFST